MGYRRITEYVKVEERLWSPPSGRSRRSRTYSVSVSGRAARMLRKRHPGFWREYGKVLEGLYPVKAVNGDAAKQLFMQRYREAEVFEKAAKLLGMDLGEVLRAYPG